MKKSLILLIAFVLAACTAAPQVQPTPAPPPTAVPTSEPIVVVVTVVATQPPTEPPPPTQPPPPTATVEAPPTVAPTEAAPPTEAASSSELPTLSSTDGVFPSITYSTDRFSLRCVPKSITFKTTIDNTYVTRVYLYYRIRDKLTPDVSEWKNAGEMDFLGDNTYQMVFSGEQVHPDLRKKDSWFDFQLIATNSNDDVVSRTQKYTDLVSYSIDCLK